MRRGAIWDRIPWASKWVAVGFGQLQCAYLLYRAITKVEVWSLSGDYVTHHDHPAAFILGGIFTLAGFSAFLIALLTLLPSQRSRPLVDHRRAKSPMDQPDFIGCEAQSRHQTAKEQQR